MAVPDPEHTNLLIENVAAIVTGATIVLLGALRYLGKREPAEKAKVLLTERPVSHVELLECKMQVNSVIREEFGELRSTFMEEVKGLHKRIDGMR